MILSDAIGQIKKGQPLSQEQMRQCMECIFSDNASASLIEDFVGTLRDKGETIEEILGAAEYLKSQCLPLSCKASPLIDTCGTGGDGLGTFNISTAVAFILAGGGLTVAKHGNRAVSSQSGSSDVLTELGVKVEVEPKVVARCIDEVGIGFLFAPTYHPLLKKMAPIRAKIGTKTIFNLLGPLLNPAQPTRQVVGVYHEKLLPLFAAILQKTGVESAAIVHGSDGLDEITLTGPSSLCLIRDGKTNFLKFDPQSVGYAYCSPQDLKGGDAQTNAKRLKKTLKGHSEPIDHCIHLNAALGFIVGGLADNFKEGLLLAQESISSGKAYGKMEALIEMTQREEA